VQPKDATPLVQVTGPSASFVEIVGLPTPTAPSLDTIESRLADGTLSAYDPDLTVDDASIRTVQLGNVTAVAADLTIKGHFGTLVFAPHDGTTYEIVFASGGSAKAKSDFAKMLSSAQVAGAS
jgi:hypothetical protein